MGESAEFTARASLSALGLKFQHLQVWSVVSERVHIKQKVRQHTPLDKLLDCFINILAGGTGLVEINTRVRPDRVIQRAFGRVTCAEQSTISDTLNACTPENVVELRGAVQAILRHHSRCAHHDYSARWQLFDVDVTGMPAGRQGEGVTKGYFAKQKNRRGRQLGRVLATHYGEIVVDRLYDGKRQLDASLCELVTIAEQALDLTETQRKRTILRIDGGGGDDKNINTLLGRDYQVLIKIHNWRRAEKLATSVATWYIDPKVTDREAGWVEKPQAYGRPTRQLAIRKRKKNGDWSYHVLVFTLTNAMLAELTGHPGTGEFSSTDTLFAALHLYDLRGGGLETQNKSDKQGLGLSRRNKHQFAAQEMLVLLAQLAHNLVIWTRNDLARVDQQFEKYGIQRTVRDVLQIPGFVQFSARGRIKRITLNQNHPLASSIQLAFRASLPMDELSVNLGKI
jgi:hypothetical protein